MWVIFLQCVLSKAIDSTFRAQFVIGWNTKNFQTPAVHIIVYRLVIRNMWHVRFILHTAGDELDLRRSCDAGKCPFSDSVLRTIQVAIGVVATGCDDRYVWFFLPFPPTYCCACLCMFAVILLPSAAAATALSAVFVLIVSHNRRCDLCNVASSSSVCETANGHAEKYRAYVQPAL